MLSSRRIQAVCTQVAAILRSERERQSLSMSAVAEKAGLSQQMVSYVERNMRGPTLETLLRLSAALDVDLVDLLRQAQQERGGDAETKKSGRTKTT